MVLVVDRHADAAQRQAAAVAALRPDWSVHAAAGFGEASLALHNLPTVDALVTPMDLIDGDAVVLLEAVTNHMPRCLRVVIGDGPFAGPDSATLSIPHRYVGRNADAGVICAAIDRSYELQRRLGDPGVLALVDSIVALPSPPASIVALDNLMQAPDADFGAVADVIASDPAMTAKLLQLVNSAYFGLNHRITNVTGAVAVLGLTTVRNLLFSIELVRAFTVPRGDLTNEVERLHDHSLSVGELARTLMAGTPHAHDAFAAGMMHDIGMLAVIAGMPDRFVALRDEVTLGGRPLHECEYEILGTSHAYVGAYLLDHWGLPQSLVEAVARSHDAADLPEPELAPVHAVYVAEQVLTVLGTSTMFWEHSDELHQSYLAALGIEESVTRLISGSRVG